jgi:hypothetical protein
MIELNEEQRQAVDRSPEIPPRVTDPVTGRIEVLLRADDVQWIRDRLKDEPDAPRRADLRTGIVYAIVAQESYERFKAFFEEDPLTPGEKRMLLREAGKRTGWNDPGWDT